MTFMSDPRHIWNVIYNAPSNRGYPLTSPNIVPATKNDSRKFQSNFPKTAETSLTLRERSDHDPRMIREWSGHDPSMNRSSATRLATEVTFHAPHEHSRSGYHSNFHQMLPLLQKVILQHHQIRRPESACTVIIILCSIQKMSAKTPPNQNPKSKKIQNPKSKKIQNPKSEIRNPKSEIQNLHKKNCYIRLQNPKSKIQNPKIRNPKSKIQNPKSKIRNPKSEIQNPKPEIQNPKSKIRNPKSKIPEI